MRDTSSSSSWDDGDRSHDLEPGESQLGALDFSAPGAATVPDDEPHALLFTVTNPRCTVSVTTLTDGLPMRVELAPAVITMTERQLAEEIRVIAALASQSARAGQHLLIAGMMQRLGHDRVSTRSYVEHELGLPSIETVRAEKAHVFATRYGGADE